MRFRRLFLTLLIALVGAWYSPAALASDDTAAVAVNTKDGSAVFRLAFSIKKVAGDVVDSGNAAVAFASCQSCQTIAISIQVVLVTGDPEVVTPQNFAIAINQNCTSCETLASAYQWVLDTDEENVRFTPEGRLEINEIRRELRALGRSGESIEVIQARVKELMLRLGDVLRKELEPVGRPEDSGSGGEETTTTTPTETTPTVTDTTPTTTETTTTP